MSIRFTPVLLEDSITRSYHHFFTYENELFIFGGARIVWYGTDPQISYSLFKFVNKKWRTLKVGLIHHNTIIRGLTLINGNLCCLFDTQLYKIDLKNLRIMYFKNESIDYMIPYQKDIFIFGRKSGIFTVWKLDSHLFIRTQVEFQGCKPILNIKGYAIAVNENVILMHGGHIRENVRSEMFQLKIEQDYYSRLFSKLKSEAFVDVEIKMRTRKRKRSEI